VPNIRQMARVSQAEKVREVISNPIGLETGPTPVVQRDSPILALSLCGSGSGL
jgi:hypothetical protein